MGHHAVSALAAATTAAPWPAGCGAGREGGSDGTSGTTRDVVVRGVRAVDH